MLDEDDKSDKNINFWNSDYDGDSEDLFHYEFKNISQGNSTKLQPLPALPSPPPKLTCTSSSTPQRIWE